MSRNTLYNAAIASLAIALHQTPALAQHHHGEYDGPPLHVNPRWKECSFQLDSSLTQAAWSQFTREAGLVTYFRPLAAAQPMGRGNFEVSLLQWETAIDHRDPAWNDTFVHPDSDHVLFEGSRLKFPGFMVRAGVTGTTDVGFYLTKNPNANYGFIGGEVQRSLIAGPAHRWAASARLSFVGMFGPEDMDFGVYGLDVLASREIAVARWASVAPYAGVSSYLAASHEKSSVVDLSDERALGARGTVGAEVRLSVARLAVEYTVAQVQSLSFKVGLGR